MPLQYSKNNILDSLFNTNLETNTCIIIQNYLLMCSHLYDQFFPKKLDNASMCYHSNRRVP